MVTFVRVRHWLLPALRIRRRELGLPERSASFAAPSVAASGTSTDQMNFGCEEQSLLDTRRLRFRIGLFPSSSGPLGRIFVAHAFKIDSVAFHTTLAATVEDRANAVTLELASEKLKHSRRYHPGPPQGGDHRPRPLRGSGHNGRRCCTVSKGSLWNRRFSLNLTHKQERVYH